MGKHSTDWRGAWTLADRIVYLNARNETDSEEYKIFEKFYGKEKLEKIWAEHKPRPAIDSRMPQERDECA
jgi:hypothetical protein